MEKKKIRIGIIALSIIVMMALVGTTVNAYDKGDDSCTISSAKIVVNDEEYDIDGQRIMIDRTTNEIDIKSVDGLIFNDKNDCGRSGSNKHKINVTYSLKDSSDPSDWTKVAYGNFGDLSEDYSSIAGENPINIASNENIYIKITLAEKDNGKTPTSSETKQINFFKQPAKQTITSINSKNTDSIDLSWNADLNASGYEIYKSTQENGNYTLATDINSSNQNSKKINALKDNTTYFFKVRSYVSDASKKYYGEFSDVKSAKTVKKIEQANPKTISYKVTFDANKGKLSKSSKKNKMVTYDKKYGKLPKATKTGYNLKGWYTKKNGGKKITSNTKMKYRKNIKLYAQWTPNGKIKNCNKVKIHKDKANSSKVVGYAKKDQKVAVLKKNKSGWYKVKVGSKTGYIYKSYIKM